MIWRYFILPILFCSIQNLFGQEQILKGEIVDEQNEALFGAHVYLISNWEKGAITDVNGQFKMNLSDEELKDSILVTFVGYEELVLSAYVLKEEVPIQLFPLAHLTQAITITAENLIAEEFSIQKISKLEVYKNPSSKADALLAVNASASATTTDESANISFRGSGPNETGIFLNQVPIYDYVRFSQLNGIGTLSFFNTDLLKSVQVFPGNPPLEFGNTTSGLVALQTEDQVPGGNQKQLSLSLASLGFNIRQKISDRQAIVVYGNYQPSAVFKAFNIESLNSIRKFSSLDNGMHYVNHLSDHTFVKVFSYFLMEGYDVDFRAPTFDGVFNQKKKRTFTIANVVHNFGDNQISMNSGFSHGKVDFAFSRTDIQLKNTDQFYGINYQREVNKFGLKLGIALDSRSFSFEGTIPEYDFAVGLSHPTINSESSNSRTVLDTYAYLKYDVTETFILGLAFRKNLPLNDQQDFLSRQLNFSYLFGNGFRLNGAYGTFHKYLLPRSGDTPSELIVSDQGSLDLSYIKNVSSFTLSLFNKEASYINEDVGTKGVEFSVDSRFNSKLTYNLSYTFLDATVQSDEGEFEGQYDMDYFVKGGMEWLFLPGWILGSRLLFRQGVYNLGVETATFRQDLMVYEPAFQERSDQMRLPGYNLIDLNLSRIIPVSEKLTIIGFLSVTNALNFNNIRSYSYNIDYTNRSNELFNKRTIYFGAVLNFF